jgi:hypothetical protein
VFEDRRLAEPSSAPACCQASTHACSVHSLPPPLAPAHLTSEAARWSRANKIRVARAQLKKELRKGNIPLGPILAAPPEHVSTAKVVDLLVALPKVGPAKAARLLNKARISQTKTVGDLSPRQRIQLIELLHQ